MHSKNLTRDAARFLAQLAQREERLWLRPAGVGPLEGGEGAPAEEEAVQEPAGAESGAAGYDRGAPETDVVVQQQQGLVDPFPAFEDLESFRRAISGCLKCPLGTSRTEFVFGVGDPEADLLLIGEAPGQEEDRQGEPFVGRAGQLLDKILAAVELERGKGVYIANILKCRPPGNRDPQPEEVAECEPHLVKQIQLIRPKLILALGRIAAQTLLRSKAPLSKLRGQEHDYHGVPLIVTFHPAALLRNPQWKRPTWEDVQWMKQRLDELKREA